MYLDLFPVTQSKYSSCMFFVIGPTSPDPISRLSKDPTAVTCAAVPVRKSSSAKYISDLLIFCSITVRFNSSVASLITESLVIPERLFADTGGIMIVLFLIRNKFSPAPSET